MSVFTKINKSQLISIIADYDLGKLIEYRGISEGIENSNFKLTTSKGNYILTIFERLDFTTVKFYIQLLSDLHSHNLPIANPITSVENKFVTEFKKKPLALVSFEQGEKILTPTLDECFKTGVTLAKIHLFTSYYEPFIKNPKGYDWITETVKKVSSLLTIKDKELINKFYNSYNENLELPSGIIHGDLFRDNVLFFGGEINAVIDFYFAGVDYFLFDLSIALNDWAFDEEGNFLKNKELAFLDGYSSVKPLSEVEKINFKNEKVRAALRFWISRLDDLHFPRAGSLVHFHNPKRFQNIFKFRIT